MNDGFFANLFGGEYSPADPINAISDTGGINMSEADKSSEADTQQLSRADEPLIEGGSTDQEDSSIITDPPTIDSQDGDESGAGSAGSRGAEPPVIIDGVNSN